MDLPVTELLGFTANILSNVAFLPQVIKSYRTKTVEDVSIWMFVTLFATNLCWIGYAIPIGASNLWTSCIIEICLLIPIFVLWVKYRHNRRVPATAAVVSFSPKTRRQQATNEIMAVSTVTSTARAADYA